MKRWKSGIYGNVSAKCQEKTCAAFKVRNDCLSVNKSFDRLCFLKDSSFLDIFMLKSFSVNSISY